MDLNDAPVGTVLSGTGQVLEQEVPVADPSGIEPSSTLHPACMPPSPETTTAAPTSFPSSSTVTTSVAPGFRPVSPFQPTTSATATTPTPAVIASDTTVPTSNSMRGFRPVSPFKPNTMDTATTTPASLTAVGAKSSACGVPGYRPVSPFLPTTPIASSTATPYSPSTPYHPDDSDPAAPVMQSRSFQKVQQELQAEESNNNDDDGSSNSANIRGFKSVSAPVSKPPSERPQQPSMRCGGCDNLATGVIVKASGVPYHVACFKCESCSMNLKQKGFFRVEGKLYCETHAKRHAKPPGSDMVAVATYR